MQRVMWEDGEDGLAGDLDSDNFEDGEGESKDDMQHVTSSWN